MACRAPVTPEQMLLRSDSFRGSKRSHKAASILFSESSTGQKSAAPAGLQALLVEPDPQLAGPAEVVVQRPRQLRVRGYPVGEEHIELRHVAREAGGRSARQERVHQHGPGRRPRGRVTGKQLGYEMPRKPVLDLPR